MSLDTASDLMDVGSEDLPWPLPVQYIERSLPAVVKSQASQDPAGKFRFHVYTVRYNVLESGVDPVQLVACDFALVTPEELDAEIAEMVVNLYLPSQASVVAKITPCGSDAFEAQQMDVIKRFNSWLFSVVLGKAAIPEESSKGYTDSPKRYYVLPLRDGSSAAEFDWFTIESALSSGMTYRKRVKFMGGFAKLEALDFDCATGETKPGEMMLRNGRFFEKDLDDAMITCAHNGMPCHVSAISTNVTGYSCFPVDGNSAGQSYAEYFISKCGYKLQFKDQPFLTGCRLLRPSNYLRRQDHFSTKALHDFASSWARILKGQVLAGRTQERSERLELPPEICILHPGIKGRLIRGAMRLPSVLYKIEMALLAVELRNKIGVPISCYKLMEALTTGACQDEVSYERFEFLGDSILKLSGCTYLFFKDFIQTEDQLGANLYQLVRNRTLFYCAIACNLTGYVFLEPFSPNLWVHPGRVECDLEEKKMRKSSFMSSRTLADIVEAIVGAYFMNEGFGAALKAMGWLGIPIKFPLELQREKLRIFFAEVRSKDFSSLMEVDKLEKKLGYVFEEKYLLVGALSYESMSSTFSSLFRRIGFLGDGVFDFIVARHLVTSHQNLDEGKLSELKQAIRNKQNLAIVAVRHGLHSFLCQVSPSLKKPVSEFINYYLLEGPKAFGLSEITAPLALGDLLKNLATAIYLDSRFDFDLVWKIIRPLLEPLATPFTVSQHPVKELETLCIERGWKLTILVSCTENSVEAKVIINELVLGNSQNEDKKIARRLAATKALRVISHPNTNLSTPGEKQHFQVQSQMEDIYLPIANGAA
ncbi:hypothetical protein R1sor_005432 [Riccia sorocarpa]|uniref:Dicer-like protein 2 n=1 Tax=Riccia sorocarpa TaxID=122646 RepID=A0ABD3HNT3_9MARC